MGDVDATGRSLDDIAAEIAVAETIGEAQANNAEGPKPLSDHEFEYRVNQLLHDAYTFATGKLVREREGAIKDYLGEKHGALRERHGRSSVVLTEVRDTIEWVKPALMKIFTQTGELGRMEPQGPEDEEQAKQRTDYVNWVFFRDNPGFMILYDWFTDALMQKVGWAKTVWDPSPQVKREEYEGLTERQVLQLAEDEGVEFVSEPEGRPEVVPLPDPVTGEAVPTEITVFDCVVNRFVEDGKITIEVVPPEEVRTNRDARSVHDAILFQHRRDMMESDLVELGYDPVMVRRLPSDDSGEFDEEEIARETVDDEPSFSTENRIGADRVLHISEIYVRIDADGDGISEWWRVMMAGDNNGTIFDKEEVDGHPFSWLCPLPMPHRIFGLSVTDLVEDLQVIKSTILRQILDGLYLANNPRWKSLKGKVNYDHLLRNVPGGPIDVDQMDALEPIAQPYNAAQIGLPVLEFFDTVGEKRTGVSAVYQAVDTEALDKTAFAAAQKMGQAVSRVEMIARIFAETGVADVFQRIDELAMKHQKVARQLRLRGAWQEVDPSSWHHEMDATVNVGIGSGSKEMLAMNLAQLAGMVEKIAAQIPGWVRPDNIWNLFAKISENLGFKDATQFLPDPSDPQFQLPPPTPSVDEKRADTERLKVVLEHQREVEKIQLEHKVDLGKLRLGYGELGERLVEEARLEAEREQDRRANGSAA